MELFFYYKVYYRFSHEIVTCDEDDVSTAYCWSPQRSAVIGAFRSSQFSIVPAGGFSLSGPLLYRYLFVVKLDRGHSSFRNFNSTIYVNFMRVKSYVNIFHDPTCVPVRISLSKKRDLVPDRISSRLAELSRI